MKIAPHLGKHRGISTLAAIGALLLASHAGGGTTGQVNLLMPQGNGAPKADGDFVSSSDTSNGTTGMNTYYRYFIEVPSGLTHLRVQIYDADTGVAPEDTTGAEGRDRIRTNAGNDYDTDVTYTVLRPDGTTAITLTCPNGGCVADTAAWVSLYDTTTTPIQAGHWELRVDQHSTITPGNDLNGIGIRADDGDATGGGTELNLYFDSLNSFGVHSNETAGDTKTYTVYPWITAGCTFVENDFDYDVGNGTGRGPAANPYGSFAFTSRSGAITRNVASAALSANDVWKQNVMAAWGSDSDATDYGLWKAQVAISTYDNAAGRNGNYTTVWFGNPAAVNPPTANPATNSFRTYFPRDDGTAPVKPYLEQMVRYAGHSATCNGVPNPSLPLADGVTTCFTVTVRLVNPSGAGTGTINFSAATTPQNVVTANVPGGGVTYEGNAHVSQGTITGQPGAGLTGNVTWNPGAVTAGSTALLWYNVRVVVTAAIPRRPVTGIAYGGTGTGTTARYVDHTGNATQARATITLGPICELALNLGYNTEALISQVRAYEEGGKVMVEWETASEAGTAGFSLERYDPETGRYVPLIDGILPALIESPQGGRYRLADPSVSPRAQSLRYQIVEVRADGVRLPYGPFDLTVERQQPSAGTLDAQAEAGQGQSSTVAGEEYSRSAHQAGRTVRREATRQAATFGALAAPATSSGSGVRVGVRETGLYYLSSAVLAPLLGGTEDSVATLIAGGKLSLTRQGTPVAWLPAPSHTKGQSPGLYFYGEGIHDLYSAEEVYRLQRGSGTMMSSVSAGNGLGSPQSVFTDLLHAEKDSFPATALDLDPESDYWFWDFFIAGDSSYGAKSFSLDAPGVAGTTGATLTVHLQGATSSGVEDEHHAVVSLNGTILGDGRWTGITGHDITVPVAPADLLANGNQVQVEALLDSGTPYSIFYLDYVDLSYPRNFTAAGDALAFHAAGRTAISVGGFAGGDVILLDIGNAQGPRQLLGAAVTPNAGAYQVAFRSPRDSTYLAVGQQGVKTPNLRPWLDGNLRSVGNGANYLIVTTSELAGAAQRLADYRQRQGLRSAVVKVEAVMNEFSFGRSDPYAIHDFLAIAAKQWRPAPHFVLLVGAGSADYRNLLGHGDCLVPPVMVATPNGIFGADNCLADLSGNDCLPELAIGRIPAMTAQDVNAYVDKVIAYEADAGSWAGTLVALADVRRQGADFAADSDLVLAQTGANYIPQRIYLDDVPLASARALLFSTIQAGSSFIDYLGHGGMDRLSAGGLLANPDVASLQNGSRLPVLTAMTCTVNRFTVPGFPSLGEYLINQPRGGAAAVWSPSALSIHSEAKTLAEKFFGVISVGRSPRLGDVVLQALGSFKNTGGNPDMLPIYVLLGDPALRWKAAPPLVPPSGYSGTGIE